MPVIPNPPGFTGPPVVGPGTPYITPDVLQRQPTGVAWSSLVPRTGSSSTLLASVLIDICQQATGLADGYCNQVLRATSNVELLSGPNFRVTVGRNGVTRCLMSRAPILQITNVQVAVDSLFPRQWMTVPAGSYEPEVAVLGVYGSSSPADSADGGQAIRIMPGYMGWDQGRDGYRVQITYVNGWPHTSLTVKAIVGSNTIQVDDCTGWAPVTPGGQGAVGIIYDGDLQEAVTVQSASAASGPGTLTLTQPVGYTHNPGVMLSTMPPQIRWACALLAASQALTRGATTTTIHSTGGGSASGSKAPEELASEAELILSPFRRVW